MVDSWKAEATVLEQKGAEKELKETQKQIQRCSKDLSAPVFSGFFVMMMMRMMMMRMMMMMMMMMMMDDDG